MTQNTSKSNLAKLLATENISVEHGNFQTASFDVKNRILRLPIWKEMGNDLYDLLVLHEVGHALYTPEEGWHKSITEKGAGFKSFLNVIEDARIERKIKDKYPGGRRSFIQGYHELIRKDFFGINNYDLNTLPLIDRINLHYKGGSIHDIQFTADEMVFVDRAAKTVTWSDVVELAEDLFQYSKEHESFTDQSDHEFEFVDGEGDDLGDPTEMELDSDNSEKSEQVESKRGSNQSETEENSEDESESNEDDSENDSSDENKVVNSGSKGSELEPASFTDKNFRSRENELVEDSSNLNLIHAYFPEADLDKIVIPFEELHGRLTNYYQIWENKTRELSSVDTQDVFRGYTPEPLQHARNYYKTFRQNNKKVIDYLVKEFEMKKAAESHSRTKTANTGIIDSSILHTYKYNENIFKKMNITEDGKNHGLVMVVDWSGSMQHDLLGTIEQMLTLVLFCKRVSIPFEVYLFSDVYQHEYNEDEIKSYVRYRYSNVRWTHKKIEQGDLCIDHVNLLNVFSSRMKLNQFNDAIHNILTIAMAISPKFYYSTLQKIPFPEFMNLGGTPLNQSLMAMITAVPEFKSRNGVDIVNLIYLTDGEGFEHVSVWNIPSKDEISSARESSTVRTGTSWERGPDGKFATYKTKCVITDRKTKKQYSLESENRGYSSTNLTQVLLKYLRESLDINVVNFYIHPPRMRNGILPRLCETTEQLIKCQKTWKQSGFMVIPNSNGWSSLYLIKGGDTMETKDEKLEVSSDATKGQLKKAFSKLAKGKLQNRVLLSNFVEMIA